MTEVRAFTDAELAELRRSSADNQCRHIVRPFWRYDEGSGDVEPIEPADKMSKPKVYTIRRATSRTGMTHVVDGFLLTEDGYPFHLRSVAEAAGMRLSREGHGNVLRGGGMDMAHAWWHALARYVEQWAERNGVPCPDRLAYAYTVVDL